MANTEGDRVLFSRYSPLREIGDAVIVKLAGGGSLPHLRVLAATLGQPCEPHSRQASSISNSPTQKAVYTYRRTKHGFERCYHRNRFGTRSWRSVFRRIPDC